MSNPLRPASRALARVILAAATAACSRPPAPAPEVSAVPAVGPLAAPAAPSGSDPAPAPAPLLAGALADAYRGAIDPDLAIVMRLSRTGDALRGGYVYEKSGGEIDLAGTASASGDVLLDESVAGKKTGSFAGHLGPGGDLTGTWSDRTGATRRAFALSPVARRAGAPALVVHRVKRARRTSKEPTLDGGALACAVDTAYPELYGLADAKVEATVNRALYAPAAEALGESCEIQDDLKVTYAVHLNRSGLLSVTFVRADACSGCAHPSVTGSAMTFQLDTGARIPLDRLLVRGGKARLEPLLDPLVMDRIKRTDGARPEDAPSLRDTYLLGSYALEEKGLRLIAFFALAHAVQALDGDLGVVIPWAKLGGVLDPTSPAAAAWRVP